MDPPERALPAIDVGFFRRKNNVAAFREGRSFGIETACAAQAATPLESACPWMQNPGAAASTRIPMPMVSLCARVPTCPFLSSVALA